MNPYMFHHHFNNVARNMNNYLIASSYNYYRNQSRDQRNYFIMYERPSLMNSGLSGLMAYGLSYIGLPANVVNVGYRFGAFLDNNA
jgi:hypothetical protein